MQDLSGLGSKPLLSVCIPTFNRAPWLRYSLGLWVEQMAEFGSMCEIVVSDNASTDSTQSVVQEFAGSGCVRYSRNEENIGGDANLYKCVSDLARGEYVWAAGDDDFPAPNALKRAVEAIQTHGGIKYIHANYLTLEARAAPEGVLMTDILAQANASSVDFHPRLLTGVKEVAGNDMNIFTPIGASIFHRSIAAAAYEGHNTSDSFVSAESVSSHALYVADHLMDAPSYYSGYPWIILASDSTWGDFQAIFALKIQQEIMDRFCMRGADPERMKWIRRELISRSFPFMVQMYTNPNAKYRRNFSGWSFFLKNRNHPQTWILAFKLGLYLPRHLMRRLLGRSR